MYLALQYCIWVMARFGSRLGASVGVAHPGVGNIVDVANRTGSSGSLYQYASTNEQELNRPNPLKELLSGGNSRSDLLVCKVFTSRWRNSLLTMSILLTLSSCAVYHPKPLTDDAVTRELRPKSLNELRVLATQINHPTLQPVRLDPGNGITPTEAAIIAVLANPKLRAERNRRGLAQAQLIQAGILPNPSLSYNIDPVTGGNTHGTVTAYGVTASWEVTSLITQPAKVKAAKQNAESVSLDVAWDEWQTAEAARIAVYRLVALEEELATAKQIQDSAQQDAELLRNAVAAHNKTELDLATAESSRVDAESTTLATAQELEKQQLELRRSLGLPPDAKLAIRKGVTLPTRLNAPSQAALLDGLPQSRLDLLALQKGYQSQEEMLRAAILAQFPKISFGLSKASDTTNVHTAGIGVTIDIPVFDRNQGNISIEKATRQKLFDEYTDRVFEARADIATALAAIRSLNVQINTVESAVPIAQHLLDTAREAFQQGNTDVMSYEQARREYNNKLLLLIKLKEQLVQARSALEIASGRITPGLNRAENN
jgi:cobalt-zinc-cadmium efflux system outer membrane protein